MKSIILILGLTGSLLLPPVASAKDCAPSAGGGTSGNGRYDVEVKNAGSLVFSLRHVDGDKSGLVASVAVDPGNICYHITAFVSDTGRFAVVDTQTRKKDDDRLVRIYSSAAKEVSVLTLSSVLTAEERTALPTPGKCPDHVGWFKSGSMKIEKEALILETLAGRKVIVNLADGKIAKEEPKKEGPDASVIQEGACPGGHDHAEFIGQCLSCKKEWAGCGVGDPGVAPVRPRICRACADALTICQLCLKKK